MKKYFFTGFVSLLPIVLTLLIAWWLFDLLTNPLIGITEQLVFAIDKKFQMHLSSSKTLVLFISRIAAFILFFILIFLLGICGQKFLNNVLIKQANRIFSKIPLVRSIYRLSHDVTKALLSENKKTFKETVLVPFPHQAVLSIGFVTGQTPSLFKQEGIPPTDLAVFVPTAPYPASGFVLLVPKSIPLPVDVSVEDAFKFLISCGVLNLEKAPHHKPPL